MIHMLQGFHPTTLYFQRVCSSRDSAVTRGREEALRAGPVAVPW